MNSNCGSVRLVILSYVLNSLSTSFLICKNGNDNTYLIGSLRGSNEKMCTEYLEHGLAQTNTQWLPALRMHMRTSW